MGSGTGDTGGSRDLSDKPPLSGGGKLCKTESQTHMSPRYHSHGRIPVTRANQTALLILIFYLKSSDFATTDVDLLKSIKNNINTVNG